MSKVNTYSDRLVCSRKIRKIIEEHAVTEYKRVHKLDHCVKVSHEVILVSMVKYYLGGVDYYNELNSSGDKKDSNNT